MYRPCKTYADQSKCVSEIAEACISLKRKLGYSDPDARTAVLDNLTAISRSGQLILNLLDSWQKGNESVRQAIPQLLGLQTVTVDGVQFAANVIEKTNRLALVLLGQFQVENVVRNISRELKLPKAGTGFYRSASALLASLNIPNDRMDILNTPARVRNSLHANGIHHRQHPNETSVVVIRGVHFEFHDGQHVSCASWEHIAHAFEASVGVLEEIFFSAQVRGLADPIMDQYAWEQVTKPGVDR